MPIHHERAAPVHPSLTPVPDTSSVRLPAKPLPRLGGTRAPRFFSPRPSLPFRTIITTFLASMGRSTSAEQIARAEQMLADLKRAGLKRTAQREAIVRHFAGDETHPTAQELYDRLRPEFPQMSFATVYNTLDALAAAGLSGTLRLGQAARFDPNTAAHHHVVCESCGAVADLPAASLAPSPAALRRLGRAAPGFRVHAVERIYRGVCGACERRPSTPKVS